MEGLRRLAAAGVPVTHLELENELHDGQQNLGRWCDGAGRRRARRGDAPVPLGGGGPEALAAVVASCWWPGMDAGWNSQVLGNTTATAATFQFYTSPRTSLDTLGITAALRARGSFATAFATSEQIRVDAEAQIPERLRI